MAAATTQDTDTITAIATAPGFAGVGVVRLSGPRALEIGEETAGPGLQPRRATLRSFRDPAGRLIDTGVVVYFAGPKSFTGEDVVELQGHGGPVVMQMLLEALVKSGARLARPGEFTERAYLNGKLDLAQAEAVADLIAGATAESVRGANRSLSGEFSERVHGIDQQVLELRTFVEAAIDFPDEDIDLLAEGQVLKRLERIIEMLISLRADCEQGVMLRDGIRLALIGAPNVGKSSVLNRLLGESRAIVTDVPGTTRDLIRADLNLAGLPVQLTDTAGLRSATDVAEIEGVRRALEEAAAADLVLWIDAVDNQNKWSVDSLNSNDCSIDESLEPSAGLGGLVLKVLNKQDLLPDAVLDSEAAVRVSALTGDGFETLKTAIRERVGFTPREGTFTARRRHLVALQRALESARQAGKLAADTVPGELIAEELRSVHAGLGEIVGQVSSDELLGEIFSNFCIGK